MKGYSHGLGVTRREHIHCYASSECYEFLSGGKWTGGMFEQL